MNKKYQYQYNKQITAWKVFSKHFSVKLNTGNGMTKPYSCFQFFCFSQFAFKTQMYIFQIFIHSLPTISCHFTLTVNVCLGKVGLLSISIA